MNNIKPEDVLAFATVYFIAFNNCGGVIAIGAILGAFEIVLYTSAIIFFCTPLILWLPYLEFSRVKSVAGRPFRKFVNMCKKIKNIREEGRVIIKAFGVNMNERTFAFTVAILLFLTNAVVGILIGCPSPWHALLQDLISLVAVSGVLTGAAVYLTI